MLKIETTTDCIKAAESLQESAKLVKNEKDHAAWWNEKVEVLNVINNAFETGYYTGEAYNELWAAKHIIIRAEAIAGAYAIK